MKGIPIIGTSGGRGLLAFVAILGVLLAMAPEAWSWGRRSFGGEGGPSPYQSAPQQGYGGGGGSMYIYPAKGQSLQREQQDKADCYTWAVQQSGFNPANPQVRTGPPPAASAPQGGLVRGAAGGAALGAVGGAIGGDTGKGAAIGAATGALFGGMRRRRGEEQQQYQQSAYMEQRQAALNHGHSNFNRAFATCMTGRGYTVGG